MVAVTSMIFLLWYFYTPQSESSFVEYPVGRFANKNIEVEEFSNQDRLVNARKQQEIYEKNKQEEVYDLEEAKNYLKKEAELRAKMNLLVMNDNQNLTIDSTCQSDNKLEESECVQDLFLGCANSLYLGYDMTAECKQFSTIDYRKYLEIKKQLDSDPTFKSQSLVTQFGEMQISQNVETNIKNTKIKDTTKSSIINPSRDIVKPEVVIEERKIIEPNLVVEFIPTIKNNVYARSEFYGWVTGWATLFATKGGKKEAGQIMNQFTAFGYNPYLVNTCITSLPYKTIDKFFGTNLDLCVKRKDVTCIIKIKNLVKDRAIEVIMLKNGKRAVFPLGDFGPAEWTGNAIDFTSCAKNVLGATGKDLVKFRPLP